MSKDFQRTRKNLTKKVSPAARKTAQALAAAKVPPTRSQPDAVSLLRADHKELRQLLTALKTAEKPAQRQRLLTQVTQRLHAHTKIEEEIFYPAFRTAAQTKRDEQLFHEATAEHHAAELVLDDVESADDATPEFSGRAKVLQEIVEHHAKEEETDMFPRAREVLAASALRLLGRQMAERKRVLLHDSQAGSGALQKMADFVSSSFSGTSKAAKAARLSR